MLSGLHQEHGLLPAWPEGFLASSRTESCGGAGVVCAGTPVPPRDPLPPAQRSQREAGAWGRVWDGASMVLGGKDHPPRPGASSEPQGVVGLGRDPWRRSGPAPAPAAPRGAVRPAPSPGGCWRPRGGAQILGAFFFCVWSPVSLVSAGWAQENTWRWGKRSQSWPSVQRIREQPAGEAPRQLQAARCRRAQRGANLGNSGKRGKCRNFTAESG